MMIKKISLYGILTAIALIFSYIESLFSLSFIAPGVKLGLANTVALFLISQGDIKGGVCVNIARVLLSNLLFSSPFALIFSLSGAMLSMIGVFVLRKCTFFSLIGLGIVGAVLHNIAQLVAAGITLANKNVFVYLPFLLVSAAVTGVITGGIGNILVKRFRQINFFVL